MIQYIQWFFLPNVFKDFDAAEIFYIDEAALAKYVREKRGIRTDENSFAWCSSSN